MATRVLVVWLDGAEPTLTEEMAAAGELPTLAGLRARGSYGRLVGAEHTGTESSYGRVLTGQPPERTGSWTTGKFDPASYSQSDAERWGYNGWPAFVALGSDYRVATFDVPGLPHQPDQHGAQIPNWGVHSARVTDLSQPPGLSEELLARHGRHPAGDGHDYANADDPAALADLHGRILRGLDLRAAATCDLLGREPWDLFFTAFGEPHAAGHAFWPHPECLPALAAAGGAGILRAVYRAIDKALGCIVEAAGPDCRCVVFSVQGMGANAEDLPSMVFLPELLFRYSFPGQRALDFDDPTRPPSPESQAGIKNWVMEMWHCRARARWGDWLRRRLPLRWAVRLARWFRLNLPPDHPSQPPFYGWQPTTWYQPYWPFMKAFALVSNSDGFIRLNVRGRERAGTVAPAQFTRTIEEIERLLHELRNPTTGRPAVVKVLRLRSKPDDGGPDAHDADLIVKWCPSLRNQLVSPRFGRFGPVPYHRPGGHTPDGFLCAAGPGIPTGGSFTPGTPLDVAPTVLGLLGADGPRALPGRCLVEAAACGAR